MTAELQEGPAKAGAGPRTKGAGANVGAPE